MVTETQIAAEKRVLLLAPTPRDGEITCTLLERHGICCVLCADIPRLTEELQAGAAALLLTEEALKDPRIADVIHALEDQPSWSDLPVIMLMRGGGESDGGNRLLRSLRNVTLLERPTATRTLASTVAAAVRGRERQYFIRELLLNEKNARIESERAGRMKDEFLATLSHELRTPLTAILGWSQLIRSNGEDRETLDEGLAVIDRNARIQVQLIEDLLDMSRIISGKVRLDVQECEPASFIDAAIATVQPAMEAKGLRLHKIVDASAGPISGDPNRLQQVVWNLLSNATKFTPRGGRIEIVLKRVDSSAELTVSDTGHGIDPEFLPHVFERFRQADASSTRAHGGLGLGLAIVKHILELHGGTIEAHSAGIGKGSSFTARLPIAVLRHPPRLAGHAFDGAVLEGLSGDDSAVLKGITVLVVDDEPDTRALVKRVLERCQAKVIVASSAAEGLALLESGHPDVILSDIGMPQVDGYEFLRRVRAQTNSRTAKIPAIALTAFARSEDRTRSLLAGFLIHVSKPVEPHELIATVATVAGRTGK